MGNISGRVVFDENNAHGQGPLHAASYGNLVLVHRGSSGGGFAPFKLKAQTAAKHGAKALLVINWEGELPAQRIGTGQLWHELRVAFLTRTCCDPTIPVLLLPRDHGKWLRMHCGTVEGVAGAAHATFQILHDDYPRRSLSLRVCQACALMLSGIGILYGVINCFSVEVGGEFLQASRTASANNIPCVCIDVDMNRFWSRVGMSLIPTPTNLFNIFVSWLAFPRRLFQVLFPTRGSVDVVGLTILHVASFPLKTWAVFFLAVLCSDIILSYILQAVGSVAERGAEAAGAVTSNHRLEAQYWIMLLIELYALPQIYDSVAASRDEAMYQAIVTKSRECEARRSVVVVGAAHANGILTRVRTRGL